MSAGIYRSAKIIWDYHLLQQALVKSDCLFVLCSNDIRVAEYAAQLFLKGYAPYIVFSGNVGEITQGLFPCSEAEHFANIAREIGVPNECIYIEPLATNTGDNIIKTRELLMAKNLAPQRFILVQKPFMERRTLATFEKLWPNKSAQVTSPRLTFDEYANDVISYGDMINVMVGDLQRIRYYPELGFSTEQDIPAVVWQAYENLVAVGFDDHLATNIPR
ncbi:YdcF family protein [uncultured Photobacterium sp.]|uniref:YdcF family protein n=1 Tax=uncultured Photobacterium sp. TaxID=173973 RepID=UPI002606FA24|nr:YdcF family protein [uncultured Photobacterium sp.]